MVGRLGATELAAVTQANRITFLFQLAMFGASGGVSVFTAQFWGKKDLRGVRSVQGIGLIAGLIVAAIIGIPSIVAPQAVLSLLLKNDEAIRIGADYLRKHSSRLWLSILPQSASGLDITVRTDKSSEYLTKTIGYSLMDFAHLDFSNFSFLTYAAPKIRRVQMKVKKFVYYKLILRLPKPGTRVTVLGYDQQVRYSSNVK